jgi:predicted transglutaminase-like cysteine proteinase
MDRLFNKVAIRRQWVPGADDFSTRVLPSILIFRQAAFLMSNLEGDLTKINRLANEVIAPRQDADVYGTDEYWPTVDEILTKRAGDCEDLAIVKWSGLHDMGYPPSMFCIATVMKRDTGIGHAVLVCTDGNRNYILDSMRSYVYIDQEEVYYDPIYAYGAGTNWRFT